MKLQLSNAGRRVMLLGAGLSMGFITMGSAFVSTGPTLAVRADSQRSRVLPVSTKSSRPSPPTMVLFGAAESLPIGALVSNAVVEAHANALGAGWGMGTLLAAEEMDKPPNIYGPIAQGGIFIVLSGVVAVYILSIVITNLSDEQFMELNDGLRGGDEYAQMEAEGKEQQTRFEALQEDMKESKDPTIGEGLRPSAKRAEKLEEETERALQTDLSSLEDEYGD